MNTLLIGHGNKGRLLTYLTQKDFKTGFTLIDPDGSLAETVADHSPEECRNDVFYFDPSDIANVASFNVFEDNNETLVDDVSALFDALFVGGKETLTRLYADFLLRTSLTILLDSKHITFLSVLDFLSDTAFQRQCLKRCTNDQALANWAAIQQWDKQQRSAAYALVQVKLGTLLLSPTLHRTLQSKPTFTPKKTKVFIANLSRQKLGDETARLLGTLLIARSNTPVYINDYSFFASTYLTSLFSRGKYTVLLNSLSDVPQGTQHVVLGFQQKYVFRVPPEDAEQLKFYVGVENIKKLVDQDDIEFQPPLDLPTVKGGRLRKVVKHSNAKNTRRQ